MFFSSLKWPVQSVVFPPFLLRYVLRYVLSALMLIWLKNHV